MNHFASTEFLHLLNSLPVEVEELAKGNYELLKRDAKHPSLHFKKAAGYWSVRVGKHYRALGQDVDNGILWRWIGTHAEYERLLSR